MQCIVTYVAGLYWYLSKISSEVKIFNSGYLSYGHCILTWGNMWGSVVTFRGQKGPESKI